MLALMFVLVGIIIYAGIFYQGRITEALTREVNPITVGADKTYITAAMRMLTVHRIILIVGVALVVLLPFYSKLLKKINTNVDIADNGGMEAIDISGEDA